MTTGIKDRISGSAYNQIQALESSPVVVVT